ncbi:hypothetical protein R50345_15970 [Paenibacillus sp. FSL R5-0345]|uniref:competence protein CoiA n=1 Tax=Paenibacillus sp. FSL R5-0345 TaxID=1536770 RepID=UPI0004F738D8|nr:competence protein CoiA family protein [Paenibacillus sp. FSL R5-0345]AIQ35983.1 hypothetical protein R50345_15970 [Paenibacillus sp. FSL R5-0345]
MLRSRTSSGFELHSTICDEKETRRLSSSNELHCPNCNNLVRYKNGPKTIAHFAHKPNTECVISNYERETDDHLKGKNILFNWLTSKFPDAIVKLEVFIQETDQIADVLLVHVSGEMKGQKWAFEFQHSPLSEVEWKKRHFLYQQAGILDFWIFDANVFLQYSRAQNVEQARLFRDPIKAVFSETGFTYFFYLESQNLTIDCNFYVRTIERKINSRKGTVDNEYIFHDPIDHTEILDLVDFHSDIEEQYTALVFSKIKDQFDLKFNKRIQKIKSDKDQVLVEKRRYRLKEIFQYCSEHFTPRHANVLNSFCLKNKPLVVEDILGLEIPNFIEKYRAYMENIIQYLGEFELICESEDIVDIVVTDQAPSYLLYTDLNEEQIDSKYYLQKGEIYDRGFIEKVPSFSIILYERYANEVKNVQYVLDKYSSELEKLLSCNPKIVDRALRKIDHRLVRVGPKEERSLLEFALGYAKCKSTEEVDELMKRIRTEIIDYDPFSDLRY